MDLITNVQVPWMDKSIFLVPIYGLDGNDVPRWTVVEARSQKEAEDTVRMTLLDGRFEEFHIRVYRAILPNMSQPYKDIGHPLA